MRSFNLEKAKIGVKVTTTDGRPVRIICWDRKGPHPIVGLIDDGEREILELYTKQGLASCSEGPDKNRNLVLAPIKREQWGIMVYGDGFGGKDRMIAEIFNSKEFADRKAARLIRDYQTSCDVIKLKEWTEE